MIDHMMIEKDGPVYRANFKKDKLNFNLEAQDILTMVDQIKVILGLTPLSSEGAPISKYLILKENLENPDKKGKNHMYSNLVKL